MANYLHYFSKVSGLLKIAGWDGTLWQSCVHCGYWHEKWVFFFYVRL